MKRSYSHIPVNQWAHKKRTIYQHFVSAPCCHLSSSLCSLPVLWKALHSWLMKPLLYCHLKGGNTTWFSAWNPELSFQVSMIELYTTSLHNNTPDQYKGMLSRIILPGFLESFLQELLVTPTPTNILRQVERPLSLYPQMQLWLMRKNAQIFNHETSNL